MRVQRFKNKCSLILGRSDKKIWFCTCHSIWARFVETIEDRASFLRLCFSYHLHIKAVRAHARKWRLSLKPKNTSISRTFLVPKLRECLPFERQLFFNVLSGLQMAPAAFACARNGIQVERHPKLPENVDWLAECFSNCAWGGNCHDALQPCETSCAIKSILDQNRIMSIKTVSL